MNAVNLILNKNRVIVSINNMQKIQGNPRIVMKIRIQPDKLMSNTF